MIKPRPSIRRAITEPLERRVLLNAMPTGPEFRVNTYTTSRQFIPSMGMDADGDFVIAWSSDGQDGSSYGIYAQRFNAAGAPQGGEFRVNTFTERGQNRPSVAMDADGDFVIAWDRLGQKGVEPTGVFAQRFNAAGVPQGGEFRVNTSTAIGYSPSQSIGMGADGNFVIAWETDALDGDLEGIHAQRFNAAGIPQGGEFRVNTYTTSAQEFPSVAMDSDGDFVIAWTSYGQDGSFRGVYAQRYSAAGVPQGSEFRVNTYTSNNQLFPKVGMNAAGDFVIGWSSDGQDGSGYGIYAQRYDAAGVRQGGEFRVSTQTSNAQNWPSLDMGAAGHFVVTWTSEGQDGSGSGVYAQQYDATGVRQGGEFRVNTYTTNPQIAGSVGMDADGNFVVAWSSDGQDGSSNGVYAQRYAVVAAPAVSASSFLFETAPQRLSFVFNQNVGASLDLSDIVVQALPNGPTVNPTAVSFDGATNTATFTFSGILPDANFRATLIGAGITSPSGAPMQSDHVFDFFFLSGDANRDGRVNLDDFNVLAANFGQSPRDFTQGDFTYDAVVNLQDFNILAGRFGSALSAADPAGDAGRSNALAADGQVDDDERDELLE